MKKIIAALLLSAALFVPIPTGGYRDGGTRTYTALTYKIVRWQRFIEQGQKYTGTSVYWLTDKSKSLDELWEIERERLTNRQ